MIVDAHNHIGKRKGLTFLAEDLLKRMDKAGVDQCVVMSHSESIDNDYTAQAVKKHPDRLIGFAVVNPWDEASEDDLRRCVEDLRFEGLWLHPVRHGYHFDDHDLLDPLCAICSGAGIPIIGHGTSNVPCIPNHFEEMAQTFPDVPFIISHMGYMYETNSAMSVAARNANVYLEMSGVFVRQIKKALREVGAKKLLLGTNNPEGDFEFEIRKIELSTSDPEERKLMLGQNILRILGRS